MVGDVFHSNNLAHLLDIPLGDLHAEICERPQHQVEQIQSVSTTTKTPGYKKNSIFNTDLYLLDPPPYD